MLAAPEADRPVDAAEFARAMAGFEPFERRPRLAVGVSGGSDSMALTLLAAAWAGRRDGRLLGLIVDHGLRAGSAGEAARVSGWLRERGVPARILRWEGPKPATGIEAAAREARHTLLAAACREAGILHLLLGHQAGDLAETAAMRAEGGSGPLGLAGMASVREVQGLRLLRPLLGVPRERLAASLRAAGQPWTTDPSPSRRTQLRDDPAFDPVRWRAVAVRAAARRAELEDVAAAAAARLARPDPLGFVTLTRAGLHGLDPEGAALLLGRCIAAVAGARYPPSIRDLAPRLTRLAATGMSAFTLGGALVRAVPGRIVLTREPGRITDRRQLTPGDAPPLWDGRFEVTGITVQAELRALGADGRRQLPAGQIAHLRRRRVPAAAVLALPSLWRDGRLLACLALPGCEGGAANARWLPRGAVAPGAFRLNIVSNA